MLYNACYFDISPMLRLANHIYIAIVICMFSVMKIKEKKKKGKQNKKQETWESVSNVG